MQQMVDGSQKTDCTRIVFGVKLTVPIRSKAESTLELPEVLHLVASECRTEIGSAFTSSIEPSFDHQSIQIRLQQTEEARQLLLKSEPPPYATIRDVAEKVELCGKRGIAMGADLFQIAESLIGMARLRRYFSDSKSHSQSLWKLAELLPYQESLAEKIFQSVDHEGDVLDSASGELKKIRTEKNNHSRRLVTKIQNMINGSLRNYLQEPIFTLREGRYVIPVKAQYKGKVPGIVHDASATGQTVFIEPETVVAESNKLREIEAAEKEEVHKILTELSSRIGVIAEEIITGLKSVAEVDSILAKGRFALNRNCATPKLVSGNVIEIAEGHHPLIDKEDSIPITVSVGYKNLLITGPNTGGKTVTLKIVGLFSLMLGCGIFPPASQVNYGTFGNVFADIGDEQSLAQSLSTFSGHLKNISHIFRHAKKGDLALFDEIGAGTDPTEGAALGKAILSKLITKGVIVAASTHYGEIKSFAQENESFLCAAMEFDLNSLRPTYRLIPGASGKSHAFEISKRYGIPADVVELAESMLGSEAKEAREQSARLDKYLKDAKKDRDEAAQLKSKLELELTKLNDKIKKEEAKYHNLRDSLERELDNAIRESRQKYQELLDSFKKGMDREQVIAQAKQIESNLTEKRKVVKPKLSGEKPKHLEIGMEVTILKNGQNGTIVDLPKSGKVIVQVGPLRITSSPEDLRMIESKPKPKTVRRNQNISLEKTQSASYEIHLRHANYEDASNLLDKFFDDAVLAALPRLRIVHGKGGGILKKMVQDFLKKKKEVASFYEADPAEGGAGATIVVMK